MDSWASRCVDIMKAAEYDEELLEGLQFLSGEAIRRRTNIYDLMRKVLEGDNS